MNNSNCKNDHVNNNLNCRRYVLKVILTMGSLVYIAKSRRKTDVLVGLWVKFKIKVKSKPYTSCG